MNEILSQVFSAGTFTQMLRSATPVALAALGGSMTEQGGSVPGNGGIFTQAFETKDLDKLLARCEAFGYKTASERTTVTLESVGEIDTVLVSGVNGTLYQFYQVK